MKRPDPSSKTQVLIVGAGPAGLVLACDLLRRGIDCRLIDKSPVPFPGSRGKGLQPRTLEIMEDLGVIDAIIQAGCTFPNFRIYAGTKIASERSVYEMLNLPHPMPQADIPYPAPWVIPQWKTDEILSQALVKLGGTIGRGTELIGFTQDAQGVSATLSFQGRQETIKVQYLVGCDGAGSFVRKTLALPFAGETFASEKTILADVLIDSDLDRLHCHMLTPDGNPRTRVSLWPLPGTELFQYIATLATDEVPELSQASLQKILEERSGRKDVKIRSVKWMSLYQVNVRMVEQFRTGRVLLAGDAAHVHSSAGGQGLNTSIQDSYNLGWKLAAVLKGVADPILDTYEEERLPVAAAVLGVTTKLHHKGFQMPNADSPAEDIYQLKLNYRSSTLSQDYRSPCCNLKAGDRAPDAPLLDSKGLRKRLFQLFQGPHFTLLAVGNIDLSAVKKQYASTVKIFQIARLEESMDAFDLRDAEGLIEKHYELSAQDPCLILIRPDGYIGLISSSDSEQQVLAYLHRTAPTDSGIGN